MLLAPHGLAYLAGRILAEYGPTAHRVVTEQPYELTSVFGVGFHVADRIARGVGVSPDSRARARAGVLHLLAEAERGGSTCMPLDALLPALTALLGAGSDAAADEDLIDDLVERGDLERAERWIYRRETAMLEAELAHQVRELLASGPSDRLRNPESERSRRPASSPTKPSRTRSATRSLSACPDHRRARDRQDGEHPRDRRLRDRAGREGDAGRADRARGDQDE